MILAMPLAAQTQAPPVPAVPPVAQAKPPSPAAPPAAAAPKKLYDQVWDAKLDFDTPIALVVTAHAAVAASASRLIAWNLDDGHELWRQDRAGITALAADADDGDQVLVATREALTALDPTSGTERWSVPATEPLDRLAVRGGWIVGVAGADLVALRASDGSVVWREVLGPAVIGRPNIDGDGLFALLADGRLTRLALTTGDPDWSVPLDAGASALLAANDRVYVSLSDGRLMVFGQSAGQFEWRYQFSAQAIGAAVSDTRHVYLSLGDNTVQALDRSVGNQRWKATLGERPAGAPLLTGTVALLPAATGDISIVETKDGKTVGRLEPPAPPAGTSVAVPRLLALAVTPAGTILRIADDGTATVTLAAFRRGTPPKK